MSKSVSILGMGGSLSAYFQEFESAGSKRPTDEVWAINSAMFWLSPRLVTMGIALDNLKRDQKMDGGKWAQYVENMVTAGVPIIADVAYDEWPHVQPYPLEEVVADIWPGAKSELDIVPDLENTINMATALAIHRKFDEIRFYGCDWRWADNAYEIAATRDELEGSKPPWFVYHNQTIVRNRRDREPGEPTQMFLLGVAHERGISIRIAQGSSLCNNDRGRYVYGYQDAPQIFPVNPLVEKLQKAAGEYQKALEEVKNG